MNRYIVKKVFLVFVMPLLLIVTGWYANDLYQEHFKHVESRRIKQKGFQFVSPLLDVELPEGYSVRNELIPFKHKIEQFVEQQIKSGKVRDMSVYYRDLSDGPWFGINESTQFNPASMMKVSVLVAWLKRAEKNPLVLRRKFIFDEKSYPGPPQGIKPAQTLLNGMEYSVEQLLYDMIVYSDNKSYWLLVKELGPSELDNIIDCMDVNSKPNDGNNTVTIHGYSGFFRILYNASFLNREMSEKALYLLSLQSFRSGISAGVPEGVVVAAKFGEAVIGDDSQFHEFGIVYHPKGPYILGVMSRGHDVAGQIENIKNISALIYKEVDETATINTGH
jgi:beta-lactamase class A